jgi:hypothetical protein
MFQQKFYYCNLFAFPLPHTLSVTLRLFYHYLISFVSLSKMPVTWAFAQIIRIVI